MQNKDLKIKYQLEKHCIISITYVTESRNLKLSSIHLSEIEKQLDLIDT